MALIIFIILVLIYNLLVSGLLFPPQPFTGDEPHYLLLTSSLLQDFDTNLANNFKNQDYLAFYPGKLRPHTYPGRKKDSAYSRHSPGLAFLLLPGLALGRKISAPISSPEKKRKILVWFSPIPMTVRSALVVSLFFLLAHLIYQQKKWLFIGALFWGLSPPFIFYSHLLYPEIPAALLLLIPFWLLGKKKFSSPNWQEILISSCCFSLLPWLGVKYIPLAGLKDPALLYHQNLSFPFSQEGTFSHILQELSNSLINFTSFFPYLSNPQFFQLLPLVIWLLIWLGITGLFLPGIQKSTQISPFSKKKLNSPPHKIKSTSLSLIKKEKYFFLPARGKIVAGGFLYFLIILVTSYSFFDLHLNSP